MLRECVDGVCVFYYWPKAWYIITIVRGIPLFYIDESHGYISSAARTATTIK